MNCNESSGIAGALIHFAGRTLVVVVAVSVLLFGAGLPAHGQASHPASTTRFLQLKAKAEKGDSKAQRELARCYDVGDGVPSDNRMAAKWYRAAADNGDAEAQYKLGTLYRIGEGVTQDKAEAVRWYRLAAQQAYTPAIYNLGTAYYNGDGVTPDDVQAYAYFLLAQRAGSNEAAKALQQSQDEFPPHRVAAGKMLAVEMLVYGTGVPANAATAIQLLRELRDLDPTDAKRLLKFADMVREGVSLPQDYALAFQLYKQAAAFPNSYAMVCLAEMYESGEDRKTDGAAAEEWYLKAIRAGNDRAAIQLANLYIQGRLLKQDRTRAYLILKWAAMDSASAQNNLAKLKATMPAAEIAGAESVWKNWRP